MSEKYKTKTNLTCNINMKKKDLAERKSPKQETVFFNCKKYGETVNSIHVKKKDLAKEDAALASIPTAPIAACECVQICVS
jgi:hypothetical protein